MNQQTFLVKGFLKIMLCRYVNATKKSIMRKQKWLLYVYPGLNF